MVCDMSRPSDYTVEVADLICERIANGESLRKICAEESMPGKSTVFRWLTEHTDFGTKYAYAREEQADLYAESIVEISDEAEVQAIYQGEEVRLDLSSSAVARNRLRVDARKWYASKLAPKKFGDKVEQVLSGELTVTSQTKEQRDAAVAAASRADS